MAGEKFTKTGLSIVILKTPIWKLIKRYCCMLFIMFTLSACTLSSVQAQADTDNWWMFLNVLFYSFWPSLESNLRCFSALSLVRFRGVFGPHLLLEKRRLKHKVYHIKNKKAGYSSTWQPSFVDLWLSPVYHRKPNLGNKLRPEALPQINQFCCQ